MKKIGIVVVLILFLSGCILQNKHQNDQIIIENTTVVYTPPDSPNVSNFNVIVIGWDGVQRDRFFDCYYNRTGECPNGLPAIEKLSNGKIYNLTVTDGATHTKPGWVQLLTGYNSAITGTYSNAKYQPVPENYSIFEKLENHFGNIITVFLASKPDHTGAKCKGEYTKVTDYWGGVLYEGAEPFGEPWCITKTKVDYFETGMGENEKVGEKALQMLDQYGDKRFFMFFHFGDPDETGHRAKSFSAKYVQAIQDDDLWLKKIMDKLTELNISDRTYIYVVTDHGFDTLQSPSKGVNHFNAPYGIYATNDISLIRSIDRKDLTPTLLERYGVALGQIDNAPPVDGYPAQFLQTSCIPEGLAYLDYPGAPVCCNGLSLINLDKQVVKHCEIATGGVGDDSGYCTKCGDGICMTPENKCNCPADCK
ncbi:Type I phosphodiesterase / nucleotide pyrophosphatase [Candidatus Bilamarchaeum dharawalense]|uniref:Type I phosphodiesterase / nucleotide pyrophosphatase n=1 Tax=Candidatus Bilamarchaeum dharawalense TaxID=2885759 RepID=A0A5E4LN91_9ARCH|nr:Type I phosphodiesterase / nucleotide pyrophosphatase [Candidatus Bilamarchaeum dharawalense]